MNHEYISSGLLEPSNSSGEDELSHTAEGELLVPGDGQQWAVP